MFIISETLPSYYDCSRWYHFLKNTGDYDLRETR